MKILQAHRNWITILYKDGSFEEKYNSSKRFQTSEIQWLTTKEIEDLYLSKK
jgi:hypothetical protein